MWTMWEEKRDKNIKEWRSCVRSESW